MPKYSILAGGSVPVAILNSARTAMTTFEWEGPFKAQVRRFRRDYRQKGTEVRTFRRELRAGTAVFVFEVVVVRQRIVASPKLGPVAPTRVVITGALRRDLDTLGTALGKLL